jgi:hypothetical protein
MSIAWCYTGTGSDSNGTSASQLTDNGTAHSADDFVQHHSVATYLAQLDALSTSEHQQCSGSSTAPAQKGFRLLAAAEELLLGDTDSSSSALINGWSAQGDEQASLTRSAGLKEDGGVAFDH